MHLATSKVTNNRQIKSLTTKVNTSPLYKKSLGVYNQRVTPLVSKQARYLEQEFKHTVYPACKSATTKTVKFTLTYGKQFTENSIDFTKSRVIPALKTSAHFTNELVKKWFTIVWHKIESTQLWNDVFLAQVQKIYQSMENKSHSSSIPSSSTAISTVPSSTTATTSTTSATTSVPEDTVETIYETIEYTHTISTTVSNIDTTMYVSTPSASVSSHKELTISEVIAEAKQEIDSTIEEALNQLVLDAESLYETRTAEAKPDIVKILRDQQSYAGRAVQKLTKLATILESENEKSQKVSRDDVYPVHEKAVTQIAQFAVSVRNRSEVLANDVLADLPAVRQSVLDALDDFFAYTLERVQGIMDHAKFDEWRKFNSLKETMKLERAKVENFEFDLGTVNTALRESQTAAMMIAEENIQQLANLRARCQLVFQGRDVDDSGIKSDEEAQEKVNAHKTELKWKPSSEASTETEPDTETETESNGDFEGQETVRTNFDEVYTESFGEVYESNEEEVSTDIQYEPVSTAIIEENVIEPEEEQVVFFDESTEEPNWETHDA